METFYLETFYRALELILIFWLLGLLFKWVLVLVFGRKGARIIGFVGYSVNFALKKFLLKRIFQIEVYECDPFQLKFTYEETDRWDVLFSSLVVIPMAIGLFLGSLLGSIGLLLENHLGILAIFLYVLGFLVAVNSTPTLQDVQDLKKCSVRSIVIWFAMCTALCGLLAAILVPFLQSLGILIAIVVGILGATAITFYIPGISSQMEGEGHHRTIVGGTIDLDN